MPGALRNAQEVVEAGGDGTAQNPQSRVMEVGHNNSNSSMESTVSANGAQEVGGQEVRRRRQAVGMNGTKAHEQRLRRMEIQFGRARLLAQPWEECRHRVVHMLTAGANDGSTTFGQTSSQEVTWSRHQAVLDLHPLCGGTFRGGLASDTGKRDSGEDTKDEWGVMSRVGFLSPVSLVPRTDSQEDPLDSLPATLNQTLLSPIREECSTPSSSCCCCQRCEKCPTDSPWRNVGLTSPVTPVSSSGYSSILTASMDSLLNESADGRTNGSNGDGNSTVGAAAGSSSLGIQQNGMTFANNIDGVFKTAQQKKLAVALPDLGMNRDRSSEPRDKTSALSLVAEPCTLVRPTETEKSMLNTGWIPAHTADVSHVCEKSSCKEIRGANCALGKDFNPNFLQQDKEAGLQKTVFRDECSEEGENIVGMWESESGSASQTVVTDNWQHSDSATTSSSTDCAQVNSSQQSSLPFPFELSHPCFEDLENTDEQNIRESSYVSTSPTGKSSTQENIGQNSANSFCVHHNPTEEESVVFVTSQNDRGFLNLWDIIQGDEVMVSEEFLSERTMTDTISTRNSCLHMTVDSCERVGKGQKPVYSMKTSALDTHLVRETILRENKDGKTLEVCGLQNMDEKQEAGPHLNISTTVSSKVVTGGDDGHGALMWSDRDHRCSATHAQVTSEQNKNSEHSLLLAEAHSVLGMGGVYKQSNSSSPQPHKVPQDMSLDPWEGCLQDSEHQSELGADYPVSLFKTLLDRDSDCSQTGTEKLLNCHEGQNSCNAALLAQQHLSKNVDPAFTHGGCISEPSDFQGESDSFQEYKFSVQTDFTFCAGTNTMEPVGMSRESAATLNSVSQALPSNSQAALLPGKEKQSQVNKITSLLEKWNALEHQLAQSNQRKPPQESTKLACTSELPPAASQDDSNQGFEDKDLAARGDQDCCIPTASYSVEAIKQQQQFSGVVDAEKDVSAPASTVETTCKYQSAFSDAYSRMALPHVQSLVAKFSHSSPFPSAGIGSLGNERHIQQSHKLPCHHQAVLQHLQKSHSIDLQHSQVQNAPASISLATVNARSENQLDAKLSSTVTVEPSPCMNITRSHGMRSTLAGPRLEKSTDKIADVQLNHCSESCAPFVTHLPRASFEPSARQALISMSSLSPDNRELPLSAAHQQVSVCSSRHVTATSHNTPPVRTSPPSYPAPPSQTARARVGTGHSIALLRLSRGQHIQSPVFKRKEEEMRQDGRTVYKSHEEQSFSETRSDGHPPQQLIDSGFGSSSMMREDFGTSGAGGMQNGDPSRDPNVAREERQREDFHFSEMSSMKNQFERGPGPTPAPRKALDVRAEVASAEGGVYESQPTAFQPQWQEEAEEGVYENEPVQRSDVVKESDRNIAAELPAVGMARNIRERFQSGKVESQATKREVTLPTAGEGGVFENQPRYNPDVVHSGEEQQEEMPEHGTARHLAAKFKQLEKQGSVPSPTHGKREITPDRTGRVEYVSEPRGYVERYEGQAEAGVFESQPTERPDVVKSDELLEEALPERGTAKNIAQQFRQLSSGGGATPRNKREITPDSSGQVEYVSEPRGYVETYEGRAESGVFESQPVDRPDVIKSDHLLEEALPERGAARNIAAKFREMESTLKSPPQSPVRRKEFTPPRDDTGRTVAGVVENTPTVSPDVVHSGEEVQEILPERGTAKSMVNRFKQMGSSPSGGGAGQSPRPKKEFTPPPAESGVFENNPQQFVPDYNPPPESGIIESHPQHRADVIRGDDPPNYEQELPERGFAKSLVSAWRQRESETKVSPTGSGKPKEFTPPREEPRVAQLRTPKSPSHGGPLNEGSVHPSDLPDQYQRQEEPSVFESEPERLEGVVSEQDTDWADGLPKKDTTKKMLAKFKHIQAEATKEQPRPVPSGRKEEEDNSSDSTPDKVVRSKSMRVAVQLEKCGACGKTVYAMEKIEIEKNAYHKACFRCSHCHCVLTPKTFAVNNHVIFCTNHYKQLFATKGNYDEGFGRDQHKKRWKSESNLSEGHPKSPQ